MAGEGRQAGTDGRTQDWSGQRAADSGLRGILGWKTTDYPAVEMRGCGA